MRRTEMSAYSISRSNAQGPLLPLRVVARWLRFTYQAPFRDPPGAQNVKTLERYRRSSLLRIITFNITLTLLIVSVFSLLFIQAQFDTTELIALLILIAAGVISLIYNERGKITVAGAIYLYGF